MGWAKRAGDVRRADDAARAVMLERVKAVVDVQHLYRDGIHTGDRGSRYRLKDGSTLWEADAALQYAAVIGRELKSLGASVWTNDPHSGILVGPYSRRHQSAMVMGANLYLACHLNAGGGAYASVEYMRLTASEPIAKCVTAELEQSFSEIHRSRTVALAPGDRGAVCVQGFTTGPAIILEPLFGDYADHQGLLTLVGLERVGQAIVRGIVTWARRWGVAPATTPEPTGPV
jgi:N-acetylmuramoyl-L-alanine amidase